MKWGRFQARNLRFTFCGVPPRAPGFTLSIRPPQLRGHWEIRHRRRWRCRGCWGGSIDHTVLGGPRAWLSLLRTSAQCSLLIQLILQLAEGDKTAKETPFAVRALAHLSSPTPQSAKLLNSETVNGLDISDSLQNRHTLPLISAAGSMAHETIICFGRI